jgi:DNA polymerase-3 subunit delta'
LPAERIFSAIGIHGAVNAEPADLGLAAALAEGSLRRAILMLEEGGIERYRQLAEILRRLPDLDVDAMHGFADRSGSRTVDDNYLGFLDLIRGWLARRVRGQAEPEGGTPGAGVPLERWAGVWEKVKDSSDLADELNLDRKQVVLSIFMNLARATRM